MPTQWGFAVAAFLMMLSLGLLYQLSRQNKWYARPVLLLMKGGTTAIASLLALAGALLWPTPYAGWLAAGLLLCALADVLLELRFPLGMLAFALGHLCYIAALLQMGSFTALHGLLFGLIALALGVAAHCDACIGFHMKALVRLGATLPEIEEALGMCVYMGGGPSLMYASNALAAYKEFTAP